jgi:hypothetical protein
VSTAHVESTVNQLINWRFCKKQQMSWTRAGAQDLLHVKAALLNGLLVLPFFLLLSFVLKFDVRHQGPVLGTNLRVVVH